MRPSCSATESLGRKGCSCHLAVGDALTKLNSTMMLSCQMRSGSCSTCFKVHNLVQQRHYLRSWYAHFVVKLSFSPNYFNNGEYKNGIEKGKIKAIVGKGESLFPFPWVVPSSWGRRVWNLRRWRKCSSLKVSSSPPLQWLNLVYEQVPILNHYKTPIVQLFVILEYIEKTSLPSDTTPSLLSRFAYNRSVSQFRTNFSQFRTNLTNKKFTLCLILSGTRSIIINRK